MKFYLLSLLTICFIISSCSTPSKEKKEVNLTDTIPAKTSSTDSLQRDSIAPKNTTISPPNTAVKVDKNYLLGKIEYGQHPDFEVVKKEHTNKPEGEVYLRKEAYSAFIKMYDAAKKDGIKLIILSGSRNFDKQKAIWDGKWKGKYAKVEGDTKRAQEILKYSAMPCTSRHHWGTDMDLNDLSNATFEKGKGKEIFDWLVAHAHEYGFCNVYSAKGSDRPNGYEQERWHWSYLPLAKGFTQQYLATIKLADIEGFEGSDSKTDLDVIQQYVGGIAGECK